MKNSIRWAALPTVLTLGLAIAPVVQAGTVNTPLPSPVVVQGTSGGGQSGSCGFVSGTPTQVVVVGQATPLRFRVQGQGQPTLLITGGGQPQCVMADSFSNGTIEIPGVWNPGTYSVFVGDRSSNGSAFTLFITQEN